MANTVKCRFCHKEISKSTAYSPKQGMYYCDQSCYEQAQDKKKPQRQQKNFKSFKGTDREKCTDFIQSLYLEQGYTKSNIPWVLVGSQLKNILESNPTWKYSGIRYTLWYMHDILEMNMFHEKGTPLNLVEFYYNDARDYYMECEEIKKAIEDIDWEDEVKVVKRVDRKDRKVEVEF